MRAKELVIKAEARHVPFGAGSVATLKARISANFIWSVLNEAIGKGVYVFANIYLAQNLGVKNYGLFTLAQVVTIFLWSAVDLGTNMYGIREIARNKEKSGVIINQLLTLRVLAGIVVFSLFSLSIYLTRMSEPKKLVFIGCGIYLLTNAFYTDWALKGLERFKYIALGSITSSVSFLLAILLLVRGPNGLVWAAFAWALSFLCGSISLFFIVYFCLRIKFRPNFNLKAMLTHARESIFYQISGILVTFLQYAPVLLLSLFFTNYDVGLFAASYRIVSFIYHSGFMIMMAFYPVLSSLFGEDRAAFFQTQKKFLYIMLCLSLPLALFGTLFAKSIMNIIFTVKYAEGGILFMFMIWLVPIYFLRYVFGPVLQAAGRQRLHSKVMLGGVLTMLVPGFLLIYFFRSLGAVFSLLLSEAVVTGLMYYNCRRLIKDYEPVH